MLRDDVNSIIEWGNTHKIAFAPEKIEMMHFSRKKGTARVGGMVDLIDKTITLAARGVLPVWRTTPTATLFRDAGLPSGTAALEEAKARFAMRLKTVDDKHPLVSRIPLRIRQRGRGAGTTRIPETKIQRLGTLLPDVPRPRLVPPHFTSGSRRDPADGKTKKEAAAAFEAWWQQLPPEDITIFSDGSEQYDQGNRLVGYGGIRTLFRDIRDGAREAWWSASSLKLSRSYRKWGLPYLVKPLPELELPRHVLHRLLAIRTTHGDFTWYHTRFQHHDANLRCACGKRKSPLHIAFCRFTQRRFFSWPHKTRPRTPPSTIPEAYDFLKGLLNNPADFQAFLTTTEFYSKHCTR
ncbi:uncharacterized protein L3040_008827 [Drepanopeziza brunnea f. sp. 'multigermtubi']|uniref:uncharacterized protein n=1 Tax=Drepanopeziza brunnea f. sp. 'multigermtubi' TaxID=698441 RepID=UPI00239443E7|nr:hypothetical protein L3040_008827 [Drepanopeziza brunnea f. sp. 'multigermtubi']